jgi:hypothetical protein
MTNDILKMAQDAGFSELDGIVMGGKSDLEAFAKLVAAKEREACAKLVELNADACRSDGVAQMCLYSNAAAIRARGGE